MLTAKQKADRYIWCRELENYDFDDFSFVDETSIRISDVGLYHRRKKSTYPPAVEVTTNSHAKINVWGLISYRGTARLEA